MTRRALLASAGAIGVAIAFLLWGCAARHPVSAGPPPFDGTRFENPGFKKSWTDILRFYWERDPGPWQARSLPAPDLPPPAVARGQLRVTLIGHATALIQLDGLNVLTDPIWSERASPVQWAGPKRFIPPALTLAQLPPIHAVLISHNHYDHLDMPTLKALKDAHNPLFVVGQYEGDTLRDGGITRIAELGWQQSIPLNDAVSVTGLPAQHWTGRGLMDRNHSLWMSFALRSSKGAVYFAGDTGYGPQFAEAAKVAGPVRLALLPIGAYRPRWLTDFQHMDPCQAVQAHQDLGAQQSLAIHYGTFAMADDGQDEPVAELARCLAAQKPVYPFTTPAFGRAQIFE